MSISANGNTEVSDTGGSANAGVTASTGVAGSSGPGANMGMGSAVALTLGAAAAGLLGLGLVFRRKGEGLPALRVDAANALNVYFSWLLIDGTLKVIAYHFHGHKLSQAYLLIA